MSPRPINRADVTLQAKPASQAKKRLVVVGVLVAAFLVVEALLIFPSRVTLAQKQSDFKSFVTSIQLDVVGCAVALADGYHAPAKIHAGDTKDMSIAQTIIQQDESYCTIAVNSDLYNLITLAPPNSLNSYNLTPVVKETYGWAFPSAAAILADSQVLLKHPANSAAISDIRSRLVTMQSLLRQANSQLAKVSAELQVPTESIKLSATKSMPGFLSAALG